MISLVNKRKRYILIDLNKDVNEIFFCINYHKEKNMEDIFIFIHTLVVNKIGQNIISQK